MKFANLMSTVTWAGLPAQCLLHTRGVLPAGDQCEPDPALHQIQVDEARLLPRPQGILSQGLLWCIGSTGGDPGLADGPGSTAGGRWGGLPAPRDPGVFLQPRAAKARLGALHIWRHPQRWAWAAWLTSTGRVNSARWLTPWPTPSPLKGRRRRWWMPS